MKIPIDCQTIYTLMMHTLQLSWLLPKTLHPKVNINDFFQISKENVEDMDPIWLSSQTMIPNAIVGYVSSINLLQLLFQ
jgi:hypothetical protein